MIEIIPLPLGAYYAVRITHPGYLEGSALSEAGEEFLCYLMDSLAEAKKFAAAKMVERFRDNNHSSIQGYQRWDVEAFETKLHIRSIDVESPNQAKYRFYFNDTGESHEIDVALESEVKKEQKPVPPSDEDPTFSTPPHVRQKWVA